MLARLMRWLRQPAAGPIWVEPGDLRRRLRRGEMCMVIDVRGPDEFDGPLGHIAGALNVPLAGLAARTTDFARAECPIVLVCLTDKRSSRAAAALGEAGVRNVTVLRGGMTAWRAGERAPAGG